MKNKEKLIISINTLLSIKYIYFGTETSSEVIFGLNELLEFLEDEYDTEITMRFKEYDPQHNEKVVEYLQNDWIN